MPNIMGKFKSILKQPEDEVAYDDYYDDTESLDADAQDDMDYDEPEEEQQDASAGGSGNNNVISIHDSNSVQFVLFKPEAFDPSVKEMANELMKRNTVILNVEDTNKDVSRRIIDFLGGVAYANSGNVKKVAEDTFIIMPSNVTLSGQDAMDEVGSDNVYF
ncbi:MAG: cell division protein SepF [Clostridia bacterium]|nr:cell division protein SepF [Clostridia bacterium]